MFIDFLTNRFNNKTGSDAIIWKDTSFSYEWLSNQITQFQQLIDSNQMKNNKYNRWLYLIYLIFTLPSFKKLFNITDGKICHGGSSFCCSAAQVR